MIYQKKILLINKHDIINLKWIMTPYISRYLDEDYENLKLI